MPQRETHLSTLRPSLRAPSGDIAFGAAARGGRLSNPPPSPPGVSRATRGESYLHKPVWDDDTIGEGEWRGDEVDVVGRVVIVATHCRAVERCKEALVRRVRFRDSERVCNVNVVLYLGCLVAVSVNPTYAGGACCPRVRDLGMLIEITW